MQVPVNKAAHPQMTQKEKFGDCPVEVLQVQIIDEIVQVLVEKELHPPMTQKEKERFCDFLVEVPKVQIIDKIMQVPIKKEAHSQEKNGSLSRRSAKRYK